MVILNTINVHLVTVVVVNIVVIICVTVYMFMMMMIFSVSVIDKVWCVYFCWQFVIDNFNGFTLKTEKCTSKCAL